jgi:hypothetical protein
LISVPLPAIGGTPLEACGDCLKGVVKVRDSPERLSSSPLEVWLMRRARALLGLPLSLGLLLPGGTAAAATHVARGGNVTVGQHWTLEEFYPNGRPALCMRETIETGNQFAFPPNSIWTNGSYTWHPRTNQSVATLNETWFDGFLNAQDTFSGSWVRSIRGFVGTSYRGVSEPAQVVKGTVHDWQGVQCETK